jgi:hypothetical protein
MFLYCGCDRAGQLGEGWGECCGNSEVPRQ